MAHFEIVIDDILILNMVLDDLFYQDIPYQPSSIDLITLKEDQLNVLKITLKLQCLKKIPSGGLGKFNCDVSVA